MKIETKRRYEILKILVFVFASLVLSININTFVWAGELVPGGFTGITLFVQRIASKFFGINIPYTIINFSINIVPAVICYRKIGKKFTIYSCIVVVLTSIFTDVFPHRSVTEDLLLICIFGGLLNGLGISLCLLAGATSGGSDFLSMLMAKKGITNSWYYIFIGNAVLITISGFTFGWDKALYSIIFQFTSTQIINTLHLRYKRNTLFIITDYPSQIYEAIKNITHHGGTIFKGTGCYMHETKSMVYSVVASDEVRILLKKIKEIDKNAFINMLKTERLIGKFYQPPED